MRRAAFLLALLVLAGTSRADAQDLLDRTPNLRSTEVPAAGSARFAFLHRFELVGDSHKIVNYPTFVLSLGLADHLGAGVTYASRSEIGAGTPNEAEVWGQGSFGFGSRVRTAATVAWNTAAESVDGELGARVETGPVALLGAVRGFSNAFGEKARAAVAGGALWRLTPRLAIGGDVARIVGSDAPPAAWSAGVHVAIPGSPHTLGFVVSNVGATTLEGASRGVEDPEDGGSELRYGFAFTMPLGTLDQWGRIFRGESAEAPGAGEVRIHDFAFGPKEIHVRAGETVRWTNADPAVHSVTADDGAFDSGLLKEGEGWSRRFDEPGRYPYHCTPHPFMKGVVIVEG